MAGIIVLAISVGPLSQVSKRLSNCQTLREIHAKHEHGRATNWSFAHYCGALPTEMAFPLLTPGVEKANETAGLGVNSGEVARFMSIAKETSKSQIAEVVGPTVFFRDDVFYLQTEEGFVFLAEPTVFADPIGSLPHEVPRFCVHHFFLRLRARTARAFACKIPIRLLAMMNA
jgi:hypothetical protein